jgi:hypothetical protein
MVARGALGGVATEQIRYALGLGDENAAGDIAFFLYALVGYALIRVLLELAFPGRHRGYTRQQYIVTITHQAFVLPVLGLLWGSGISAREGSSFIYLLTGAYMASDSIVNYSPVSGCVAGLGSSLHPGYASKRSSADGPIFSWGVHAHHFFTVVLCALGTALPPWLEDEGAFCILVGEAGSLWITVTLMWPTPTNFILRFYSYLGSRLVGVALMLDIVTQLLREGHPVMSVSLLTMGVCLSWDNWRTLGRMRSNAKSAAAKGEVPGSPDALAVKMLYRAVPSWPMWSTVDPLWLPPSQLDAATKED